MYFNDFLPHQHTQSRTYLATPTHNRGLKPDIRFQAIQLLTVLAQIRHWQVENRDIESTTIQMMRSQIIKLSFSAPKCGDWVICSHSTEVA